MNAEKKYHKSRRMFFVINEKLVLAEIGCKTSHYDWLINQGWSEEKATNFIKQKLRGVIDPDGNIKFFTKENWEINEKIENEFFKILPELVEKLKIKDQAKIFGGAIKQEVGKIWPPRKDYGTVGEILKKLI